MVNTQIGGIPSRGMGGQSLPRPTGRPSAAMPKHKMDAFREKEANHVPHCNRSAPMPAKGSEAHGTARTALRQAARVQTAIPSHGLVQLTDVRFMKVKTCGLSAARGYGGQIS
jgi:hypothetical protein